MHLVSLGENGIAIHVLGVGGGDRWHSQVRLIEEHLMEGLFAKLWPGEVPRA